MAAGARHGLDDRLADLARELVQLGLGEPAQFGGRAQRRKNRHVACLHRSGSTGVLRRSGRGSRCRRTQPACAPESTRVRPTGAFVSPRRRHRRRRDGLERPAGTLDEPPDAQLGVGQQPRAVLVQGDASLVQHERLLERLTARLERLHHGVELSQGGVEREPAEVDAERSGHRSSSSGSSRALGHTAPLRREHASRRRRRCRPSARRPRDQRDQNSELHHPSASTRAPSSPAATRIASGSPGADLGGVPQDRAIGPRRTIA